MPRPERNPGTWNAKDLAEAKRSVAWIRAYMAGKEEPAPQEQPLKILQRPVQRGDTKALLAADTPGTAAPTQPARRISAHTGKDQTNHGPIWHATVDEVALVHPNLWGYVAIKHKATPRTCYIYKDATGYTVEAPNGYTFPGGAKQKQLKGLKEIDNTRKGGLEEV